MVPAYMNTMSRNGMPQDSRTVRLRGWTKRLRMLVRKSIALAVSFLLLTSPLAYAQEAIQTDGRTQTSISREGSVTNITTETILSQNAFNSFLRFDVESGQTVNLHIPSGVSNLLNLVHEKRTSIDGILNSIQDGQLGGNVFFLNPYGLVVGSGGSVNVGSLTVLTPTMEFMGSFFDPESSTISETAVAAVLEGKVPVSESGLITVDGRINAITDIHLSGHRVENTGTIASGAVFEGTAPDFSDIVNIAGLDSGSVMSVENGTIVITAQDSIAHSGAVVSMGGDVTIQAGRKIEVEGGAGADERAVIDARGSEEDGNISLSVVSSDSSDGRKAEAEAGIYIGSAELRGKDISLTASADAKFESHLKESSWVLRNVDEQVGYRLDQDVAAAEAAAGAKVVLKDGSVLDAAGNVSLQAEAKALAKTEMEDKSSGNELSVSFLYGEIDSDAEVDVQDGAQIKASNLSIKAENQGTLDIKVQSVSLEGEAVETAIAVTRADVSALARLAAGAQLSITDDLSISAVNTNDFSTNAVAKARKDGLAGIAAVYFTGNTTASALSDADLTGLKNLIIDARDNTIRNVTSASSVAGGQEMTQKIGQSVAKGAEFVQSKWGEKAPVLDEKSGNTGGLQIAGAISIVEMDQSSEARIGSSAAVSAANDIVVNAETKNARLQNKAISNIPASKDGQADAAISGAVAYGTYQRSAEAYLGSDSQIQAQRVGIGSQVLMPYIELEEANIQWDKLTDFSTISEELSKLKDLAGNPLLTSYANATEAGADMGAAGSLSYTSFINNSRAYLDKNAQVTILEGPNGGWEKTLPNESKLKWDAPLSIAALTDHTGVYAAGNFSFSLKGTGGVPEGASAGGAYNQVNHTNNTQAYIAGGAAVNQEGSELKDISITADTKELVIALGPTSGRGGSIGLNGIFAMTSIDSNTEASISDKASVTARQLLLSAGEDVVAWTVTGALNLSESAGVGVSIAVNEITTNTKAFVGPNSQDGEGLETGTIKAEGLLVNARTDGRIEAISVAGAMASSKDPDEQPSEGFMDKLKGKLSGALTKLTGKTEDPKEAAKDEPAGQPPKTEPKFGLAVSGSSSLNLGGLNTEAYVVDGKVVLTGGQRFLGIRATNDSQVLAVSGAAALSKAKNPSSEFSAGIAGSVAWNDLQNQTAAQMSGTMVTGAKTAAVQALAGGQQVAVAVGLGVNASAKEETAASAAGSVSVNMVSNDVTSIVETSRIEGHGGETDSSLEITAYDRTTVGTGGGSLMAGGKAGVGAAVTYSEISSTTAAKLLAGTQVSGFDSLQVRGLTASLIGSGGAMGGYAKGKESGTFGGAIVINTIDRSTEAVLDGAVIEGGSINVLARDIKGESKLDDLIDGGRARLEDELDYTGSEVISEEVISEYGDGGLPATSIISVAGVGQASGNNAGVSFVWNEISNDYTALVKDSRIETEGDVDVQAESNTMIAGLSVGASYASGEFAGAASVTANEIGGVGKEGNRVSAQVIDSTVDAGSLSISAQDNSLILSLAGQITAGSKASAGGAVAHNVISNSVLAQLIGGSTNLSGSLELTAVNDSAIATIAVAGGGAGDFALNGSVTSAHISNYTGAVIGDMEESGTETVVSAEKAAVEAKDSSQINALAGALTGSKGAAVGGAISVNTIGNDVIARVGHSTLTLTGSLTVDAQNLSVIRTLAAAAGGAKSAAISGSLTVSTISNTTEAEVVNTGLSGQAGAKVAADDQSVIHTLSGGIAGSGSAAIGGAAAASVISNETRARVVDSQIYSLGLTLEALNQSEIMAASMAGSGAGDVGVNGSITGSVVTNTTEALLINTDVEIAGGEGGKRSIGLKALDDAEILALAGSVSGAGTAAVGGAASVNTITNTTHAKVVGGSVTGGDDLTLEALNDSTIKTASAAGGGSGTAAVNGSATTAVIANSTLADISGAELTGVKKVGVTALDKSDIHSLSGSASFSGTAAVGGAVTVNTILNETRAKISDSALRQIDSLELGAANESTIKSAAAAGQGAGTAAVGGSNNTSIIKNSTEAELVKTTVGDGEHADAAEAVAVTAKDASRIEVVTGHVGISGTAAVGAAVGTNVIANTTAARINQSGVNAGGATLVQADNRSEIETISVSGEGSGTASVGGSIAVSQISNTTEAEIIDSQAANQGSQVTVLAADESRISSISGGAAVSGTASVGAAVSVNRIANTTTARVRGGQFEVEDLLVKGTAASTIKSAAVGLGGSGVVGVAGSTAVNLIDSDTESYIDNGAKITARDNVGVLAETHDVISNWAGAAGVGIGGAGVGASVTVSHVGGSTRAYISGADTEVTALAQDQGDKLTIAEGGLQEDVNLGDGLDLELYTRPQLAELRKTEEVTGIAVAASGTHSVENVAANAAGGLYAGVAGTTNTTVITGETEAYVDEAKINTTLGSEAQGLHVKASDHAYSHSFVGSVGGGLVGAGAGIDTAVFSNSTRAYIRGSNPVQARGAAVIDARATQGASSLATSAGGGIVGVAGAGTVGIFQATTEAYLQSAPVTVGALAVNAEHDSRLFVAAGSAGIGGAAAGGAFTVAADYSETRAYVANAEVAAAGSVEVNAENETAIRNWAASGQGGGAAGVAGSALVTIVGSTTQAYITGSDLGSYEKRVGGVSVQARDRLLSENRAGAVGLGVTGVGVGAGAAVTSVNSTTSAYVDGSRVYSQNDLLVQAEAERDISTIAVSAGVGSGAGLGGTAVVTLIGRKLSGDVMQELDTGGAGTLTEVDSFANSDRMRTGDTDGNVEAGEDINPVKDEPVDTDDEFFTSLLDSAWGRIADEAPDTAVTGGLTDEELASLNKDGQVGVKGALNSDSLSSQTSAVVNNSNITVVGDVEIHAAEKTEAAIHSGAAGIGGSLGVGGSIGVLDMASNVRAEIAGASSVTTEQGTISVKAETLDPAKQGSAIDVNSYQGSGGMAALGAAVATANVTNNVLAGIGKGSTLEVKSSTLAGEGLLVQAHDYTAVNTTAYGASIGLAAAGVVSANGTRAGRVAAVVGDDASVNLASGGVRIEGLREGETTAYSRASAGGGVSGNSSLAAAKETGQVEALVGTGADITASSGSVEVEAIFRPQAAADSRGYGGAIYGAIGLSLAQTVLDTEIRAAIGAGGAISADSLAVRALTQLTGSAPTARSYAEAAGIGGLVSANAAVSLAQSKLRVSAVLNSDLNITDSAEVLAGNTTRQEAKTLGVVGGLAAAGASTATAEAQSTVTAEVGSSAAGSVAGTLTVDAAGSDDTHSSVVSGSGGIASGAAALAKTTNKSTTLAQLGSSSNGLTAGTIALAAMHTALFNGQSDSTNASVVGASGARTLNDIAASVTAKIGEQAKLETYDLTVSAENIVRKAWLSGGSFNVNSGSGGFLDGAAALSQTDIDVNTNVVLGSNAIVNVIGDRDNPGRTNFRARNDIEARDKVRLDAGGAISLALAKSVIDVDSDAKVSMNSGAQLDSVGDVNFASYTRADVETSANSKTYGLASAAQGEALSSITADNSVAVGSSASIRADGNVNFYAGRDEAGHMNTLMSKARSDLFNKTAFPIKTKPIADALVSQNNRISIGSNAAIRSVRDVSLITSKGSAAADGQGVGKDLYRELAEEIGNAFSSLVGAGEISLDIKSGSSTVQSDTSVVVDGRVHTGIQNKQEIVFDADGKAVTQTEGVSFHRTTENVVANMFSRLNQLYQLRANYAQDPAASAAYDAEINYIKQELLSLGYAEQHGSEIVPITNIERDYINLHDIEARAGNVFVEADSLTGSGQLRAPSDTSITITNHSKNFLRVSDLTIDPDGGYVYFNKVRVSSAQDINARNPEGSAAHLDIDAAGSSSSTKPAIEVRNTYQSMPGVREAAVPPDIELVGDIENLRGSVTITNADGSIKILGRDGKAAPVITAETLEISAGRDIVQSYVDGFQHIGGDPQSLWWDIQQNTEKGMKDTTRNDNRPGTGSWIAANNIFLSARYLNINGTIRSGTPARSLMLDSKLESTMDEYRLDWNLRGRPSMSNPQNLARYKLPTGSGLQNITAYYNPETDQIVLEGVKAQGGYIEVYGHILNTGGGRIEVLDGYTTIDIQNNTSRDIVVNGLDTGRINGLLRITDTGRFHNGQSATIVTEYTRSGGVMHKREYLKADQGDIFLGLSTSSGRSSSYQPGTSRYVWMRGQDRTDILIGEASQTATFWGALPIGSPEWEYDETTVTTGQIRNLPQGIFADQQGQGANYQYSYKNYTTSGWALVSRETDVTYHWADIIKSTPTYHVTDTWKRGSKDVHIHSVKADHPIAISFIGQDQGRIDVESKGSILLAGAVRDLEGNISLRTQGSILQATDSAVITGKNINLSAGTGIGDHLNGVAVQLVENGSLTAAADRGDINIYGTAGDLRVGSITAARGNVMVSADQNIVQAAAGSAPVISGNRIDLITRNGAIGTAGQPLNIRVGDTNLSGLNATSAGDISIRQSSGDLRLIRVESVGGDVTLEVASGSMIDANPEEQRDTRVIEELERLWDEMLLTEETAEESIEATLRAYRQAKESEYHQYWRMRNVRPVFDQEGDITGYEFDPPDPSNTDPEYQRLHEEYGSTAFDPNWRYTISDEERAKLTEGSVWTRKELETSISGGILFKDTTSTETRIKEPNVIGRNITLRALNGSVGTDDGVVVIDGSNPDELKDEAKRLALAAAEPDDVAVDNDTNTITVLLRKSVNIAASGNIDVEAKNNVYLGSRAPIYVKTVQSGGSIRIKGADGIYNVSTSGPAAIQGGRTILEGGASGGIGTAETPLTVALRDGSALTARAAEDIHVQEVLGSLHVAEINGQGNVILRAKDSILDARGERPLAVRGSGVNLIAEQGGIGTAENPFHFEAASSGQLTAQASGSVYLIAPTTGLVNLGDITSGGVLGS
jgi:filamentous hemagglutinin family protein